MRLMILNGPNLNLLGVREPHIYGSTTLAAIQASCEEFAIFASAQLSFHQSNHEGVLVDLIQSARENADAIIINPAGYSFTSIAILDALKAFEMNKSNGGKQRKQHDTEIPQSNPDLHFQGQSKKMTTSFGQQKAL